MVPGPLRLLLPLAACAVLAAACNEPPPPVDPKVHAEGLYIHGTALYLSGRFDEALEAFQEVEKILPDHPRLPAAFGEVYLSQGKLNEALTSFKKAAAQDPRRSTNWSRIGFILTQLGEAEEARSALRKAVSLHPRDHVALESLGDLDFREGKLDSAVSHWRLAAEASPTPDQAATLWLRAARVLQEADKAEEALALLKKAAADSEAAAAVLAEYANALVDARKFEDALQAYTRAARKNPNDPGLWELAGELHLALDRPGDAITAFRESLKVKDRALVHIALARIHKARDDEAGAKEELEKALATATGEEAREAVELARLLRDFGRKKDALKVFQTIATEPGNVANAALQVETASLARALGDVQTAAAACKRAREADGGVKRCP